MTKPRVGVYWGRRILKLIPVLSCAFLLGGCGMFTGSPPPPNFKCTGVVKTAYNQVGKKYRMGGASPQKGFDCSGLVWWSYKQHGIKLPRITTDQAKTGKAVPKKQVKPGDILVFKTGQSPRGLHTGLYAGADSFIHSPGKGKKVCLEKLSAAYWRNKLIAVRRITN